MLSDDDAELVYLACRSTDLRNSIDGLATLVKAGHELDPFSPCLSAFCNSQRGKIRVRVESPPSYIKVGAIRLSRLCRCA